MACQERWLKSSYGQAAIQKETGKAVNVAEPGRQIDSMVKSATRSPADGTGNSTGEVTVLPKVYGRGLDFECRDKSVIRAGGVHVIQTFLSAELSEEIQIKVG